MMSAASAPSGRRPGPKRQRLFGGEDMKADRIAWHVVCLAGVVLASQASAQTTVPVTIQLPSFSTFSVDTTVMVPDSGRGYLGRVNRINQGRTSAGAPFGNKLAPGLRNHATGRETTHAGMGVTASILDRMELDPYTREAALDMRSAARDENDLAGLAIDYLRARGAAQSLARHERQDTVIGLPWERNAPAPSASTARGTAAETGRAPAQSSAESGAALDARTRGLLNFRNRRSSSIGSTSLQSRDRSATTERRDGLTPSSAARPRIRANSMVYPAPPQRPASDLRRRATTRGPGQ